MKLSDIEERAEQPVVTENSVRAENAEVPSIREILPTLCAGESDRDKHTAAVQQRSGSQSKKCREKSGLGSRRDCFAA